MRWAAIMMGAAFGALAIITYALGRGDTIAWGVNLICSQVWAAASLALRGR